MHYLPKFQRTSDKHDKIIPLYSCITKYYHCNPPVKEVWEHAVVPPVVAPPSSMTLEVTRPATTPATVTIIPVTKPHRCDSVIMAKGVASSITPVGRRIRQGRS